MLYASRSVVAYINEAKRELCKMLPALFVIFWCTCILEQTWVNNVENISIKLQLLK